MKNTDQKRTPGWKTALVAVLTLGAIAGPATVEAQNLYWTTANNASSGEPIIRGANSDGRDVRTVFTTHADLAGTGSEAVDITVTADHIYWTMKNGFAYGGGVWRANRDGREAVRWVLPPQSLGDWGSWAPQFVAIDEANDKIYFTCYFTGLYSAPLSTGGRATLLGGTANAYAGLAQKGDDELLFTTGDAGDTNAYLMTVSSQQSGVWNSLPGSDGQHYGLAFDRDDETLYYTSAGGGALRSFVAGGAGTNLLTGLDQPLGLKLSASETHLVYAERGSGLISSYEIATGEVTQMVAGANAHFGVAIFGDPEQVPGPPPAIAGWQKIDDFDDRPAGTIHAQGGWSVVGDFADVIENPYGPGKVLRVSRGRASHLILIPEGETGTLFFRARPFGNDDFSFGTSRSTVMSNFSVSAGQLAFRASGRLDIVDNESGNHIKPLGTYDPHEWYDVWMVIDNGANTVRYYVRGGDYTERTLLADANGTTVFNHRSPDVGDILSFGLQGFGIAPMLVDQVWINAIEADLSDPSPAPQDTQPATQAGPLLAYEGFNYEPGSVFRRSGGNGWIYEYFVYGTPYPQVADPGFQWDDLQVSANRLLVNNPGSATNATTFRWLDTNAIDPALTDNWGQLGSVGSTYVSFVAKGGDPTSVRFFGLSLFRSGEERIFVGKASGGSEWLFREYTPAPAFQQVAIPPTTLSLTEKYFMVIKLDQPAGKAYLFANPDLTAGEPAMGTAVATLDLKSPTGNWGFNNIRLSGAGEGVEVDEIRIGTTWDSVTPTGAIPEGYAGWAETHFGAEASNPAVAGPEQDPDGDGISNLVEYALGGAPLAADVDDLPVHGTMQHEGDTYLTLTFSRPVGITDISYEVQASTDLVSWSAGPVEVTPSEVVDGIETVTYRDVEPLSGANRRFLRLRVSQQ